MREQPTEDPVFRDPHAFDGEDERDIGEYGCPNAIDAAYIQRKLQLAGEMKTAIKRFLDHHELDGNHDYRRRARALRHAMEDYLNCEEGQ